MAHLNRKLLALLFSLSLFVSTLAQRGPGGTTGGGGPVLPPRGGSTGSGGNPRGGSSTGSGGIPGLTGLIGNLTSSSSAGHHNSSSSGGSSGGQDVRGEYNDAALVPHALRLPQTRIAIAGKP